MTVDSTAMIWFTAIDLWQLR